MSAEKKDFKTFNQSVAGDFDKSQNAKRRENNINRFLNSYFKVIVLIVIILMLWGSFYFIIRPKFQEASSSSNLVIQQKRTEFLRQYNKLQEYKNIISEYAQLKKEDIYKVKKIVPESYSRDDLFTEMTYFLIKNKFKIDSINISDPRDESESKSDKTTSRRGFADNLESPESSEQPYRDHLNSLPPELGVWLINLELSNLDYPDLKKLLNLLENNLKIIDVYSLDYYPSARKISIGLLTYYQKNTYE